MGSGIPIIVGAAILFLILMYFWFVRNFMFICKPNEVLIFSGGKRSVEGESVGFRVVKGGRAYRKPLIESVDRMDLTVMPVHIRLSGAYSEGNIPLNVHAIANVKVSSDERLINNAIERFLGRHTSEVQRVAKETLEGNLRGILAQMTPENVNEDRLDFAKKLQAEAEADLNKLGLHLDTLKIQNVSDDVDYLDSIGRARIAEALRDAEISESDALREAENVAAEARRSAQVAKENAEAAVQQKRNELRRIRAQLDARVKAEEEKATGSADEARAEAAQSLEQVRIELENLRLQAEKVIPSEIEREAAQLIAEGNAAEISAKGNATARALQLLTDVWLEAGDQAMDIYVVQQVERIMAQVARAAASVTIDEVALIDGGDGSTIPQYVASYPRIVSALLKELAGTLGIDVASAIGGQGRPVNPEPPAGGSSGSGGSKPKQLGKSAGLSLEGLSLDDKKDKAPVPKQG